MNPRTCAFVKASGQSCGAPPLRGKRFCFWHTAERSDDLKQAQRLGGVRRKREKTVALAYHVDGIRDVEQALRVLEIALIDSLSLDNSVARNRTLVAIAQAGLKVFETSEVEDRLAALEETLQARQPDVRRRR